MATLREDQYTWFITSLSVLLRMKNVSDRSCRENQNTSFTFNNFLFYHAIYEMWKKFKVGQDRWQYSTCALHAGYLGLQIHLIFISCPLQQWLRLNVTLYVSCLLVNVCYDLHFESYVITYFSFNCNIILFLMFRYCW